MGVRKIPASPIHTKEVKLPETLKRIVKNREFRSYIFATLNILSLLFHTLLELLDQKYQMLRASLPTRKTFFDDLRALTRYMYFESWDHLLSFMLQRLDLELPPNTS